MTLPHIPALRLGTAYESLNTMTVCDHRNGAELIQISQVNAGVIRRDLRKIANARAALKRLTVKQLFEICQKAGEAFLNQTLPLGDRGHTQSPGDYVKTLSSTSGLPHVMVRRNMEKIHSVLVNMPTIFRGLTRGLNPEVIDHGTGEQNGVPVTFFPVTNSLGLVMPSNSPAVNSLWLPAIPLKIPVILKPGREEPWTPFRLVQAFIAAGCPAEAFGFYPTDHEGAASILEKCGRALIFGDQNTTAPYRNNPAIQIHGPGFSKILIGEDEIENWRNYLDVMTASIADNGGRSCINASAVIVPKYAREIADALAKRLGPIAPLSPEDENAKLSGFANLKMAEYIDAAIEEDLKAPGAEEMTARYRDGARQVEKDGGIYLRPTVVHCDSFDHPLANREFLFPYASVVSMPQSEMLEKIGPTLVVTVITKDETLIHKLMEAPHVDRLNIGPISTMKISWEQPHEGNLFEFLYRRRSFERV